MRVTKKSNRTRRRNNHIKHGITLIVKIREKYNIMIKCKNNDRQKKSDDDLLELRSSV